MIRNIQRPNRLQGAKTMIMSLITRILKNQSSNSVIFLALKSLLCLMSSISILFINNPLQPSVSNQIFKILILSNICDLLKLSTNIMLIIFLTIMLIGLILILLNTCLTSTTFLYVVKTLGILIPLLEILAVPIFGFALELLIGRIGASGSRVLIWIYFVIALIILTFIGVYLYFCIRPLKSHNLEWSYSNYPQFLYYIFCLSRTFICYSNTSPVVMLIFSMVAQYKFYSETQAYYTKIGTHIIKCKHMLSVLINMSLLAGHIFNVKQLTFAILIVSTMLYLFYAVVKYIRIKQDSEDLPICTQENSEVLYAAFLDWRDHGVIDEPLKKISLHMLACDRQDCIFKESTHGKITLEQLQQKITKHYKKYRYTSPTSQLLYQIWKVQNNKTITLSHKMRDFSLEHQFIIQYILGQETSSKTQQPLITSSNSAAFSASSAGSNCQGNRSKFIFYTFLSKAITEFQKLSQILGKPLPELNQVIDVVIGIDYETTQLTKYFQEMIKNKEANYVCIQMYMKFYDTFFGQNKLSKQIVDKLKRLKICMQSQSIEQNSMPTLVVDSLTSNINKTNSQAQKLLRLHRHQLKQKPISHFLIPEISLSQVFEYQQSKEEKSLLPIFLKIKNSQQQQKIYSCCYKLKKTQNNNRNYFQLSLLKNGKSNSANSIDFIIDQNNEVIATTSARVALNYREGKIDEDFHFIYQKKIKGILGQVCVQRVARIQFQQFCLVSGMLAQKEWPYNNFKPETSTLQENTNIRYTLPVQKQIKKLRFLNLTLIKRLVINSRNNKRASQARLSQLYDHPNQFSFVYRYNIEQQIILEGCHRNTNSTESRGYGENIIDQTLSVRTLNQKLTEYIIKISGGDKKSYSQGIKVYRLYEGDLYNIDLEDRQKYNEEFNNIDINYQSSKSCTLKPNQNILICFTFLCSLILGCCIFINIQIGTTLEFVKQKQIQLMLLEEFSLNYNRMMASLRDQATGLYPSLGEDFTINVLDSYQDLQKLDSSTFLSEKIRTADYDGETYQGSLSQLIQVSLTHVYQFLQLREIQIIEKIHYFSLSYLGPLLTEQKKEKKYQISTKLSSLKFSTLIVYIIILLSSLLYFLSFLLLTTETKKGQNNFLEPLLLTSQNEIKRIAEECQKFKNVISSLYKNYQIDLESVGNFKKENGKKRVKPKLTNFGILSILVEMAFAGVTVLLLTAIVSMEYATIDSEVKVVTKLFRQSEAVMQSYSALTWATNQFEHLNITNPPQILQMSENLHIISSNKDSYQFSQQLSTMVKQVFFKDSRAYLLDKNLIEQKYTKQFMKTFEITNPFKIGLVLYFHRIYYNLISELDQTFGSNGIYSQPFKLIFKHFSKEIQRETREKIQNIRGTLLAISTMVTILSFWLVLIFIFSFFYFKKKLQDVSKGLIAFVGENVQKEEEGQSKQPKEDGPNSKQWSSEKIDEEDFLIADQDGLDQIRQE